MSSEPLDELYFQWLYAQVASTRLKNPALTYWSLARQLYTTEFDGYLPNDDNRVYDGKELRLEFLEKHPNTNAPDKVWLEEGASFLEMLIALSRRLSFADERASSTQWFWQLMANVNLVLTDEGYAKTDAGDYVRFVLQRLNDRTYDYNGRGGLFPLSDTDIDQRHVELWYQMQYYLIERS